MAKPYTQDVILDADGKPLFDAMGLLEQRIKTIGKTIEKLQSDSFKTVNNLNKTVDANLKALTRTQSQLNALSRLGATDRSVQRTLARDSASRDAAKYGTTTTRVGYELELEKKLEALRNARTEKEKRAGVEAVQIAQARLRAIQQIEAAEARIASKVRGGTKSDDLSSHRARLALSRQFAESEAKQLGTQEALRVAKDRQRVAEERLKNATALTRDELRQNLELENARLRALERITAAQARQNKAQAGNTPMVAGKPEGNSRLQNILSPSYAAAAFARTSVYGGAALAAYGTFNAVTEGLKGVVELEDELAKLQAIANATDTQMVSLRTTIFEIGRESRFSVNELAKVSQVLAQAGVSSGQMSDVLRSVTTLATASGSTPDEAVQLVTSALGSFQLQASEAARVADLMTEALNRTKLTVQQVGQAIQYVGATAYEQNISLEQMLATIGAVAQAGVRSGSTIGTGFRQFLVDLQDPSKKLNEQLKALGLSAADVDVSVRGLPAVLDTLRDAGFGAAQAYEGLEVRAAAFYLTAKNNVDVIDQLQLGFTQQGAAAQANERAMNSLTAQWQRFKNILGEKLFEGMEGPLNILKEVLKRISDYVNYAEKQALEMAATEQRIREGRAGAWEKFKYDEAKNAEARMEAVRGFTEKLLNGGFRDDGGFATQWGTILVRGAENADKASVANERLATKIAEANDKIETQRGSLAELDKELLRVITQKESLRDNETRTAAETSNLSARFQGLALNLTNTGNAYDDLVQAMKNYKYQQMQLLGSDLLAQQANLTLQTVDANNRAQRGAQNLLNDKGFAAAVNDPSVMQALVDIKRATPGSREFNNAQNILVDAINRFSNTNRAVADRLNQVVQNLGKVSFNTQQMNANSLAIGNSRAATTDVGRFVTDQMQQVEALITQLGSQENGTGEKAALTKKAYGILATVESEVSKRLKLGQSEWSKRFLLEAQAGLKSLRTQVKALNLPTSDEVKAAKAADREAERGPKVTQDEFDKILKDFTGLALGSGVRSAAEQNRLHALGLTPATAATSSHSNGGLARDIPIPSSISDAQARSLAASLKQHFKNLGVDVFVQFETGKGKNQGSGRHIHASARRGTRWKGSSAGSDVDALNAFEDAMDASQLNIDKREMNAAFKDISDSTTQAALDAAIIRARAAISKVKKDLEDKARNDLEKAGVGPGMAQYKDRMDQLKQEQEDLVAEYARRVADALIKGSKEMVKAAQESFEQALAPSARAAAIANGIVQGLGYESNRGKVPEQTMALAQQQAGRANEAADRARLDALPALIAKYEAAKASLVASMNSGTLDQNGLAQVNLQIVELDNNLQGLITTRDSLQAAFGAEGMIPTTFKQGLAQAIEAYRELNGLNLTFTQSVNNEMMGAIGSLHQGLTDMFASIFSGSASAGQAILGFAKAIMSAITQIVAKIIATQIIKLLLSIFSAAGGGMSGGAGVGSGTGGLGISGPSFSPVPVGLQTGGIAGYANGFISAGHSMRDNVLTKLVKGEWVVNKRAVDSVGHDFMADLNARGSRALDKTGSAMPKLDLKSEQKVNVWMVKPDEVPSMGPHDVLVTWQQDVLQNGQSKRLIETIVRETR